MRGRKKWAVESQMGGGTHSTCLALTDRSGWKLVCHSSLQPESCCCSLFVISSALFQPISAAQNVEFHPWSVNTLKARGSTSPCYPLCYIVTFCCSGFTVLWPTHAATVFLSVFLSFFFCSALPRPPPPLKKKWNSYSVQQLWGDFNPSPPTSDTPDHQTNVCPRDSLRANQTKPGPPSF